MAGFAGGRLPTISRSRQKRLFFCAPAKIEMDSTSIAHFAGVSVTGYRQRRLIRGERSLCE
jgi:hypothetical protein